MNYYYFLREVYKISFKCKKHCMEIKLKAHSVKISKPYLKTLISLLFQNESCAAAPPSHSLILVAASLSTFDLFLIYFLLLSVTKIWSIQLYLFFKFSFHDLEPFFQFSP